MLASLIIIMGQLSSAISVFAETKKNVNTTNELFFEENGKKIDHLSFMENEKKTISLVSENPNAKKITVNLPDSVQLEQSFAKQNEGISYNRDSNQVTLQLHDQQKVNLVLVGINKQTEQQLYAKTTYENGVSYQSEAVSVKVSPNESFSHQIKGDKQTRASDYSAQIIAPNEIQVGSDLVYEIVVNSNATTSDPLQDVELTAELPEGFTFNTVSNNPYVESYTYDEDTNRITFKLKNITDGVISFTFNVQTINDDDKYYGMSANATLTGNDVGSGVPTESKATTIITGEVTYTTSKSFTTVPGTGNRVVTYSFNISSSGSKGQFSSWKQVITDSLPAGTQIIGNEGKSGKWDIVGDESTGWQAEWISNKLHKPGTDLGNEKDFPTLTVYYPEDKFSNGTRPPKNTSNLKVYDKNNQEYDGGQGSTQGPAMSEGTPEGVGVDKRSGTNQGGGSWYDGYYNRHCTFCY